jgi:hypothetical protein
MRVMHSWLSTILIVFTLGITTGCQNTAALHPIAQKVPFASKPIKLGDFVSNDNGGGGGGGGAGSTGGSVTTPGTNGTNAQAVQGITGGVPMAVNGTVGPTTGLVTRCQGGTGSNVTTVTTTPSVICAGGSGTIRSYFNISFTSGTYSGTPLGWCSMQTVAGDNAPTQTGGDFPIQGIATSFNNGGNGTVQGNAIMCVATSAAGSISVIPTVVQSGVAP